MQGKLNAADQRSMMAKFIALAWGRMLVTKVSEYDVELLLNKVTEGRVWPPKANSNNRARKLQGAKHTPVRVNGLGEVVRKMFAYAVKWGWREDIEGTIRHADRGAGNHPYYVRIYGQGEPV